ncbi:hypothetical protein HanRHA438_Chr11g0521721 [Helianthus annuus]|nr:hypothetical protein HanRHA438_Chr11g0521721 [Helianthus annuus]
MLTPKAQYTKDFTNPTVSRLLVGPVCFPGFSWPQEKKHVSCVRNKNSIPLVIKVLVGL